jgi:hypothetical protein
MWNAIAEQEPGTDNLRDKIALPEDERDPFILYDKTLTMVRGIWEYSGSDNENADLVALLGLQINHEFVFDLISSSLQEDQ